MAEAPTFEIDRSDVGTLELEDKDVAYVNLEHLDAIPTRLALSGTEYSYERSFPIQGHSATLPEAIAELEAGGKRALIAERSERYVLFVS